MNWISRFHLRLPSREKLLRSPGLRWLAPWLSHPKLWAWSRRGVALGVALGLFFGLLIPLAQIPLSAAAAIVLRANLPAAAASTLISNPVTYGPIYYAAYRLGNWVTGESALPAEIPPSSAVEGSTGEAEDRSDRSVWQRIKALGKPLLVGLSIMATLAGLLTYWIVDLVWRWRTMRRWRQRRLQ
ncbi:MAG: DUF2062 domain-containing protein [Azonexus sp.]|nr:DUF2062 domain-containing protein [Azonexus sp.]MDP3636918.1 DUF2062 domain-containing protein [Azonexus sp.]MDZ4314288.1 DUF2062 domain-containing protein [Azonexus sp.]